jgi:hypothetical protein
MSDKPLIWCGIFHLCVWLFIWVVSLIASIVMVRAASKDGQKWTELYKEQLDLLGVSQLVKDWKDEFYVDIVTVDSDMSCPSTHSEPFLYDLWPGSNFGCDCLGIPQKKYAKFYEHTHCEESDNSNPRACAQIQSRPPIVQTSIKKFKFCARLGQSYMDQS